MKYKQFKQEATRTCKPSANERENLYHMVLGMVSEQVELEEAFEKGDPINIMEELVDKMWYLANYETFRGLTVLDDYTPNTTVDIRVHIPMLESKLADMVKKYNVYGAAINKTNEAILLRLYMDTINTIATGINLNLEEGYDRVIAKLRKRFPEKFTEELANERNLSEERKALEGEK